MTSVCNPSSSYAIISLPRYPYIQIPPNSLLSNHVISSHYSGWTKLGSSMELGGYMTPSIQHSCICLLRYTETQENSHQSVSSCHEYGKGTNKNNGCVNNIQKCSSWSHVLCAFLRYCFFCFLLLLMKARCGGVEFYVWKLYVCVGFSNERSYEWNARQRKEYAITHRSNQTPSFSHKLLPPISIEILLNLSFLKANTHGCFHHTSNQFEIQ